MMYPKPVLPLMPDIAELACRQRDKYPGQQLCGATVDVSSAYNQFPQSVNSAMQQAVQLKIDNGIGGFIAIIIILLVGMFGHTLAGDIYCQLAQGFDEKHNMNLETKRSTTYIDDAVIIDPRSLIVASVDEYIGHVETLFGKDKVVNMKKVKIWDTGLIGIGWQFNFESWTVQPKDMGLAKLMFRLFRLVPIGTKSCQRQDLEQLSGSLVWYAAGLPAGKSFVSSLFRCQKQVGRSQRVMLSAEAQADLTWWRGIILAALSCPGCLAASIDSVRRYKTPDLFLITDACTTVGGGAYVSLTPAGIPLPDFDSDSAIRWTKEEIKMFEEIGVSINVLEYYVVVFYVLLWGKNFSNKVIHVQCDNTSAVSWIVKSRANHNPAADSLAKLLSLFCLRYNITIICTHISGVDNVIADFHSRDLIYLSQDADEEITLGALQNASSRKECCRKLLKISVLKPETLRGPRILKVLMGVLLSPGSGVAN